MTVDKSPLFDGINSFAADSQYNNPADDVGAAPRFAGDAFTPDEDDRIRRRILAARKMLDTADIETMDRDTAKAMYESVTQAIHGIPDTDGSIWFGDRRSDDPRKNLSMVREVMGGNWKLLQSPESQKFEEGTDEDRVRIAKENEGFWQTVGRWFKMGLMNGAAASSVTGYVDPAAYEAAVNGTKEVIANADKDVVAKQREKYAENQKLLTLLAAKGSMSDRAGYVLTRALVEGELDPAQVITLSDDDQEKVFAGFKAARGEKTHGEILFGLIDMDFKDGTAVGNRSQMALHAAWQALMGLATDSFKWGSDLRLWWDNSETAQKVREGVAAKFGIMTEHDAAYRAMMQEKRDFMKALTTVRRAEAAAEQPYAEGGIFGAPLQGIAENWHWFIPYGVGRYAKGAKAALKAGSAADKLAAAAGRQAERAMAKATIAADAAGFGTKYFERTMDEMAYIVKRHEEAMRRIAEVTRTARRLEAVKAGGYDALAIGAKYMTTANFAQEFLETADAAGMSREMSVPMSIGVALINDRIEQLTVPGLDEALSPSALKAISLRNFVEACRRGQLSKYVKVRLAQTLPAGAKVGLTEGAVEEPLQQIVIEHGKLVAEDLEKWSKGEKSLDAAAKEAIKDALAITADDLKTYVDVVADMLPMSFGYMVTTGAREQAHASMRKFFAQNGIGNFNKAYFNGGRYDEPYADHLMRERMLRTEIGRFILGQEAPAAEVRTETKEEPKPGDPKSERSIGEFNADGSERQPSGTDEGAEDEGESEEMFLQRKRSEAAAKQDDLIAQARSIYRKNAQSGDVVGGMMRELGMPQQLAELAADHFADEELYLLFDDAASQAVRQYALPEVTPEGMAAHKLAGDGNYKRSASGDTAYLEYDVGGRKVKVLYRNESSWFLNEAGEVDFERFNRELESGSQLAVSWEKRNPGKKWEDLNATDRKIVAIRSWNGYTTGGGTFTFTDAASGESVTVEADAVVHLATGQIGDIARKVLPEEVASDIEGGERATGWTAEHETFHALWGVYAGTLTDEEKKTLAEAIGVQEDGLEEAMAYQFEQYASGAYVQNPCETHFQRAQAKFADLLGKMGFVRRDVTDREGNPFRLGSFYQAVMEGRVGSGNMGIERISTTPTPERGAAAAVDEGGIPVKVSETDQKAQEEKEVVQAASATPANMASAGGPVSADGTKISPVAESDWDKGDTLKLRIPNKPGRVVVKLRVMNAFDVRNSFAAGGTQKYQNRGDTQESKEMRAKIAANPDFEQAGAAQSMLGGATLVVDKEANAIVGNHRVDGIQEAYRQGNAAGYRSRTIAEAEARGLTLDEHALEAPILVGEVTAIEDNPTLRVEELGEAGNTPTMRGFNFYEEAQNDAKIIEKENIVHGIVTKPDGSIDTAASLPAIKNFITQTGAQGMIDENAVLTEKGQERMGAAMAALLVGTTEAERPLLRKLLAETRTLDIENEERGIIKVAADLLRLAEERPMYDIRKDLREALEKYTAWREADEAKRAEKDRTRAQWAKKGGYRYADFAAQQDLFKAENKVADLIAARLAESRTLRSFAPNGDETAAGQERAIRHVAEWFEKFVERARNVNVETDDMFGEAPASAADILGMKFSVADKVRGYFPMGTRFSVGQVRPATKEEYDGVIEKFGETKDYGLAAWLFPDGRMPMPQMKRTPWGTVRNHDAIFYILNRGNLELGDLTGYIDTFAGGAMRLDLDNGGIEMTRKPSEVQLDAIYDICDAAYQRMEMDDLDTFRVDISDDNASTLFTLSYPRKTSARRIIDDIKNFYDNDYIPDNATGPEVERRIAAGTLKRGDYSFSVAPTRFEADGLSFVTLPERLPAREQTTMATFVGDAKRWLDRVYAFEASQRGLMIGTRRTMNPGDVENAFNMTSPHMRREVGWPAFLTMKRIGSVTEPGEPVSLARFVCRDVDTSRHYVVAGWDAETVRRHLTTDAAADPYHRQALYFTATGTIDGMTEDEQTAAADRLVAESAERMDALADLVGRSGATSVMPNGTVAELDDAVARYVSAKTGLPVRGGEGRVALVAFSTDANGGYVEAAKDAEMGGYGIAGVFAACHEGVYTDFMLNDLIHGKDGIGLIGTQGDAHNALRKLAKLASPFWTANELKKIEGYENLLNLLARFPRSVLSRTSAAELLAHMDRYGGMEKLADAVREESRRTAKAKTGTIGGRPRTIRDLHINDGTGGKVISAAKLSDMLAGAKQNYLDPDTGNIIEASPYEALAHYGDLLEQSDFERVKDAFMRTVVPVLDGFVERIAKQLPGKNVHIVSVDDGMTSRFLQRQISRIVRYRLMNEFGKSMVWSDRAQVAKSYGRTGVTLPDIPALGGQVLILAPSMSSGATIAEVAEAIREKFGSSIFSRSLTAAALTVEHGEQLVLQDSQLQDEFGFGKISAQQINRIFGYDVQKNTAYEFRQVRRALREEPQVPDKGNGGVGGQVVPSGSVDAGSQEGPGRADREAHDQHAPEDGGRGVLPARSAARLPGAVLLGGFSVGGVDAAPHYTAALAGNQKRGDASYPDAGAELSGIRFSIGARRLAEYRQLFETRRPDIAPEDVSAYLDEIKSYENPKKEKLAVHWLISGAIELPQDSFKLDKAIATAARAKVDPFQYRNPEDIFSAFPQHMPKDPAIDPDTVAELTEKEDRGHGVTVYTVQDDRDGQAAMRKIINTHWGKDANPWCLLQGDGNGKLESAAWQYWEHYSALPKKVAFHNGKLLAFMATSEIDNEQFGAPDERLTREWPDEYKQYLEWQDSEEGRTEGASFYEWLEHNGYEPYVQPEEWWDRKDMSHAGVPIEGKIEGDPLGRSGVHELKDGKMTVVGKLWRGNKQNGVYEEWDGPTKTIQEPYKDGKLEGRAYRWNRNEGTLRAYQDYKAGKPVGWHRTYNDAGRISLVEHYDENSEHDLPQIEYNQEGNPRRVVEYGKGDKPKLIVAFYSDGELMSYNESTDDLLPDLAYWSDGGKNISWKDAGGNYYSVRVLSDGRLFSATTSKAGSGRVDVIANNDDELAKIPETKEMLEKGWRSALYSIQIEAIKVRQKYSGTDDELFPEVQKRVEAEADRPKFSVANRKYNWDEYPALEDSVIHSTSHIHMVGHDDPVTDRKYEMFKAMKRMDPARALVMAEQMAESIWAKEKYLGKYLLGKHFGRETEALEAVRHYYQPKNMDQLKAIVGTGRPARWIYVHNTDGINTNMIPLAFARMLADRFGGVADNSIWKKSDERNTGASMQDRASRNFEWYGTVDMSENPQVFIVDDVWTTGSTTVSLLEYLKDKGIDVRAIVTVATASNTDHLKPRSEDYARVLKKSKISTVEEASRVAGLDLRKLTGSELYAYGVKGAAGRGGLAAWFERSFGLFEVPGGLFSNPRQDGRDAEAAPGTPPALKLSFSTAFPRIDRMADDDLITTALAAGMVVNPQKSGEASKGKTFYGYYRKHRKEVEALVLKAHPELQSDYAELSSRAATIMMRAQSVARDFKRDMEAGVSESEILRRLPKKMESVYRGELQEQRTAGGQLMGYGMRARQMVEDRWQRKVADAVSVQSGVDTDLFEQWAGVDFSETLQSVLENPRAAGEDAGKTKQATEPPESEDASGSGGGIDEAKAVSYRKEELENPRKFAEYLVALGAKYWRERNKLGEYVDPWKDAVALQFMRRTAKNVYRQLVRDIVYSGARETASKAIERFENTATIYGLLSQMTFVGEIIHARHIRESKQAMCEELDTLLKTKLGAQGRFKVDQEELRRKVSAELELRARYMRHAMWLTKEAAAEEGLQLSRRMDKILAGYGEAERDVEQSREYREIQRELNILREFGSLRYKSLGEIETAKQYWENQANGSSERIIEAIRDREIRTTKAAEILAAAVANPNRKDASESGLRERINNYIVAHMGFVSMLQDMIRHSSGETRSDAEGIIHYIALEIQKAGDRARTEERRESDAFYTAVEQIYRRPFRKVMAEMTERDARFEPFMGTVGGKRIAPTKARAMQLMVSLLQGVRPGDSYYDNVIRFDRQRQAAEIASLLTAEDMNMITWLGRWYENNRQDLSEVCEHLFGIGVYSESPRYFPVKMRMEKMGLETVEGVGWTIFPKALTPRVRNERDFDTSADIFSMWMSRMQEGAQWKAHARLGLELRGIFGRSELQEAVSANHGNKVNRLMLSFITDILSGSAAADRSDSGAAKAADWIRGWTALSALGGNVGVTLKQTTSIPAFGFEIGLRKTASYTLSAFSPAGFEAMGKIWNSEQRKTRWDVGSSEAVANALRKRDAGALKRLFQAAMVTNKIGDVVPGLVVGQGIYRDCLDRGMSETDAMAETWMLIERTQQSSRLENQPTQQRRSKLGRVLYQFLSTQQQYLQYEMRAVRELTADPNADTARKLIRVLALNHFILTSLYFWMGELYKMILGQEPPEDRLKDWMISNLLGPYGSLFVFGFMCKETLERALKGKQYGKKSDMIPMESYIRTQVEDASDLIGAIFDSEKGWDEAVDEAAQWASDVNSTFRDLRKIDRYRLRPERYQKKRKLTRPTR